LLGGLGGDHPHGSQFDLTTLLQADGCLRLVMGLGPQLVAPVELGGGAAQEVDRLPHLGLVEAPAKQELLYLKIW
jgi:hypothetical protein